MSNPTDASHTHYRQSVHPPTIDDKQLLADAAMLGDDSAIETVLRTSNIDADQKDEVGWSTRYLHACG